MDTKRFTYLLSLLFLFSSIGGIGAYNYYIFQSTGQQPGHFYVLNALILLLVLGITCFIFLLSRRHQHRLKMQHQQYRQLFEDNPNPMWVFDKDSFNFLAVNQAAVALYGYSKEEFLNMSILDIRPPEDRQKVIDNLKGAPEDYYSTGIWRHYRKDGKLMHVKISSHSMHFNGRPAEIILAMDLSLQVQFEKEREQLMNNLLQQNHQLEEFAFIASHQLRAPVANILGLTNIFPLIKEEEVPVIIGHLKDSANRLDDTIRKVAFLLEKRKEVNESMEEVALEDILKQALTSMEQQIAGANASIEYNFKALPHFHSVRNYVQDIINNLLSNALKYRKPDAACRITLSSYSKNNHACILITDNGLGLDLEKHAPSLGKPFTRFHFHVPGSGIGLSLVKTQVDLLKGDINFKSRPEAGMQVEICLPLY